MPEAIFTEADFLAGRDLAVDMLEAIKAADDAVDGCCYINTRTDQGGGTGVRIVSSFLDWLRARPALVAGFAAVIADRVGGEAWPSEPSYYRTYTFAEMTGDGPTLAEIDAALDNPEASNVIPFVKGAGHA